MTRHEFSIKNVKTFRGMEDGGYEVSLYRDGKRVGSVFYAGNGGIPIFRVSDEILNSFKAEAIAFYSCGADKFDPADVTTATCAHEMFIGRMIDDFLEIKKIRRLCRTQVCFRLSGDEEGVWRTVKGKWTDRRLQTWIDKTYGDRIDMIANRDLMD